MAIFVDARVVYKVATEAEWETITLEELIKGEFYFYVAEGDPNTVINIKVGDGVRQPKDLPYMWDASIRVPFFGSATPSSTPSPASGDGFWIVSTAGTYTNYGGVVLPANSLGVITRVGGSYGILVVGIDLSGYVTSIEFGRVSPLAQLVSQKEVGNINLSIGYLDNAGVIHPEFTNWRTTDFYPVSPGDVVVYKGSTVGGTAQAVVGYNSSNQFVSVLLGTVTNSIDNNVVIPAGAITKVRACGTIASGNTLSFKVPNINIPYGNITSALGKSWGAIGHSIWWQDGKNYQSTTTLARGIQTIVREHVQFSAYYNYGYSGRSLAGTSDTDVQSILEQKSTWVACDIYTYDSITNDFKLNRPIGTTNDFLNNTGITTYYGALRLLHERLKELNPNYLMICANALQRNNAGYTSWSSNTVGHTLQDYSDALLWVRNRLSWRFVDQFNDSGINEDNLSINTLDGLHPNNAGYSRYGNLWVNEFYKI